MIHLRMLYYLLTGFSSIGFCLVIATWLKRDMKRRENYSFLLFILFSSLHLLLVFGDLYWSQIVAGDGKRTALLYLARDMSRIRTLLYIFFAHTFLPARLRKTLDYVVLPIAVTGTVFYSTMTLTAAVLYVPLVLFISLGNRDNINNRYIPLLRYMCVISLATFVPVFIDLLESLFYWDFFLFMDFYPLCLTAFAAVFLISLIRNSHIEKSRIAFNRDSLTKRENEIVSAILKGETNRDIAEKYFIAESTVKKHINNIFRKLEIKSRWELLKIGEKST
ncbi:helix-turn-helix domain-containing protein [Spirochaeta isovalerica]|uniref:DNA-binding CsgD family transcriptional regulator n=1 Tax=Spirochaeta isovalerica TaxID=150 RepID=A0A841RG10_9SPIO|nr:helix-turn-helix transcriptional regulator [Spirochaeta isovalerica]MBB6481719.1 DNA-binding CsgD family transcriptional regulator [Spirochaeta isovalerica]